MHRPYDTKVLFVCSMRTMVVLTDLLENYIFYWLNGHTIHVYPVRCSSAAWGLIDLVFGSKEVTREGDVESKASLPDLMPVTKRQRLV